jgi:hypothetical protein
MTNEQLTVALELARGMDGFRFTNIGDISCDIGVSGEIYRISYRKLIIFHLGRIGIPHESNHSFTAFLQDETSDAIAAIALRSNNVR